MSRWFFLFAQWFKRDLAGRYRGSWLGLLWPLLQPAAQIAVFTLILHGFMQVRWPAVELVSADTKAAGGLSEAWAAARFGRLDRIQFLQKSWGGLVRCLSPSAGRWAGWYIGMRALVLMRQFICPRCGCLLFCCFRGFCAR
jgi:hypothetical protein